MTSKYNIAERALRTISGGNVTADSQVDIRDLIQAISPILSVALKNSWFQQKAEGQASVNGDYVYSFDDIIPVFDDRKKMYYLELPSTYIDLPNHTGVTMVAKMESQDMPYIPVTQEFLSLSRGLHITNLQGRKPCFIENTKIYLPKLKAVESTCHHLVKLVCGMDEVDEMESLNIPTDIQAFVVDALVQKFSVQQQAPKDIISDNLKATQQIK